MSLVNDDNIPVNYIDLPTEADPEPQRIPILNRPLGRCEDHPFCYNDTKPRNIDPDDWIVMSSNRQKVV